MSLTTRHIEIDHAYIQKQTPAFLDALAAFLTDQDGDITGLKLDNLRLAAQGLARSYTAIDAMLGLLEQEKGGQE